MSYHPVSYHPGLDLDEHTLELLGYDAGSVAARSHKIPKCIGMTLVRINNTSVKPVASWLMRGVRTPA